MVKVVWSIGLSLIFIFAIIDLLSGFRMSDYLDKKFTKSLDKRRKRKT